MEVLKASRKNVSCSNGTGSRHADTDCTSKDQKRESKIVFKKYLHSKNCLPYKFPQGEVSIKILSADFDSYIYVQDENEDLQNKYNNLKKLLRTFYRQVKGNPLIYISIEEVEPGMIVAAEANKDIIRAAVVRVEKNSRRVTLLDVDTETTVTIQEFKMFKMFDQFMDIPFQSIKCRFADLELFEGTRLVLDALRKSIINRNCKVVNIEKDPKSIPLLEIVPSPGPLVKSPPIYLELMKAIAYEATPKLPLVKGKLSENIVIISHCDKNGYIWLHLKEQKELVSRLLTFIDELLEEEKENLKQRTLSTVDELGAHNGYFLAKFYADGKYYRAKIVSFKLQEVVVLYIDFGNCARVHFSDILPVYDQESVLNILPPLAIKCHINGIRTLHRPTKFIRNTENTTMTFELADIPANITTVSNIPEIELYALRDENDYEHMNVKLRDLEKVYNRKLAEGLLTRKRRKPVEVETTLSSDEEEFDDFLTDSTTSSSSLSAKTQSDKNSGSESLSPDDILLKAAKVVLESDIPANATLWEFLIFDSDALDNNFISMQNFFGLENLRTLEASMYDAYAFNGNILNKNEIFEDSYYAAYIESMKIWTRVKMLKKSECKEDNKKVDVLLVDYALIAEANASHLRILENKFCSLPTQGYFGLLQNHWVPVSKKTTEWDRNQVPNKNDFKNANEGQVFIVQIFDQNYSEDLGGIIIDLAILDEGGKGSSIDDYYKRPKRPNVLPLM